jgi:hypothetical protein
MRLLQELAESSRRLEINREQDFRRIIDGIQLSFSTLRSTENPILPESCNKVVADNNNSWLSQGMERPADVLLLELSKQTRQARIFAAEETIIGDLSYDEMKSRLAEIKEAHLETFEWIFSSSINRPAATHFTKWLKSENGLFWISGKPQSPEMSPMWKRPQKT